MKLLRIVQSLGTDGFAEAVEEDLSDHQYDLPLETHLSSGGWPDYTNARVVNVACDERTIHLTVEINFREVIAGGCPASPTIEPRSTLLELAISRFDGSASVNCA